MATFSVFTAKHTGLLSVKTEADNPTPLLVDGMQVGVVPAGVQVVSVAGVPFDKTVRVSFAGQSTSYKLLASECARGCLHVVDQRGRGLWVEHRDHGDVISMKPQHVLHITGGGKVIAEKSTTPPVETVTLHVGTMSEKEDQVLRVLLSSSPLVGLVTGTAIPSVPPVRWVGINDVEARRLLQNGGREYRLSVQVADTLARVVPCVTYQEATDAGINYGSVSYLDVCKQVAGLSI